jgi:hypothetical protein
MARKKASWVGPANPADATGILRPTGELSSEARAESERTSPRPVVKPKDPKTKNTYKEPVQKRQKPKVKTAEVLKAAEVRPATNAELKKNITEVSTVEKPKRQRKPRTTTKTGKKIDPKTGQIRAPRKGQIAKVDGQVVRVNSENLEAATTAGRTTVLPTADRDAVEGAAPQTPRPLQRVSTIKNAPRTAAGPAGGIDSITSLIGEARSHLAKMTLSRNTPEFHDHHENFNLAHAQLAKHAPAAHTILGIMKHVTVNVTPESAQHFEAADKALGDTLAAYKAVSSGNVKSSRFGRQERLRKIRAEREGTSE